MQTSSAKKPISLSQDRFELEILALTVLFLGAAVGLLIPFREFLALFGIVGSFVALWIAAVAVWKVFHGRAYLGFSILSVGSVFWFWQEVFVLSVGSPSFPNTVSYSPVFGETFPEILVAESLFVLSSFSLCAVLAWVIFGRILNRTFIVPRRSGQTVLVDLVLLAIALVGWWPFLQTFGGIQQAIARLLLMRAEAAEFEAGLQNYIPIASISSAGFALARLVNGSTRSTLICLAAVASGGAIAVLSGTRFKLIYFMAPALISAFVGLGDKDKRQSSIIYLIAVFGAIISVAAFQFANRYGVGSADSSALSAAAGAQHFTPLVFAISLMEGRPYFNQSMGVLFVTDLVPRFIWPDKPGHEYWEFYNQISLGGNVTPSMLGQYYLNWGLPGGAIVGVIFGIWARIADILYARYLSAKNPLFLIFSAFVCTFLFLSFRHYSANYFTYLLAVALLFFAFAKPLRQSAAK